jgi:hypothetical protein
VNASSGELAAISALPGGDMISNLDALSRFVHRSNQDGTFDSICRDCFATVQTAKTEAGLKLAERDHICDRMIVEHFNSLYRMRHHKRYRPD